MRLRRLGLSWHCLTLIVLAVSVPPDLGAQGRRQTPAAAIRPLGLVPRTFDLHLEGTGFQPHEGQNLVVVVDASDSSTPVGTGKDRILNGAFAFDWPDLLTEGKTYTVDYFADVDDDGACDPDTDAVWRRELRSVAGRVSLSVIHDEDYAPEACESF